MHFGNVIIKYLEGSHRMIVICRKGPLEVEWAYWFQWLGDSESGSHHCGLMTVDLNFGILGQKQQGDTKDSTNTTT